MISVDVVYSLVVIALGGLTECVSRASSLTCSATNLSRLIGRSDVLLIAIIPHHKAMTVGQEDVVLWILHLKMFAHEVAIHYHGLHIFPTLSKHERLSDQRQPPNILVCLILPVLWNIDSWLRACWTEVDEATIRNDCIGLMAVTSPFA